MLKNSFNTFMQNVWPIRCLLCLHRCCNDSKLCDECQAALPWQTEQCARCAKSTFSHKNQITCGSCLINPPPYQKTMALFHYQPPISSWILQLKFHKKLSMAALFANLWISELSKSITLDGVSQKIIMPIPLHPKRLKERGFNQALEIVKPVARFFEISIDTKSCVRIRNTAPQTTLRAEHRHNNVKNAFALTNEIKANHVILFDDVITTGQTIFEIASLLKKTGVETIEVWCCAKAS